MGSHSLLEKGVPTQGSNPGLPHCRWILYRLSHQENPCIFPSVQFSRSVVSDSLRPHESQYTRPPCPTPTPGAHPLMSFKSVMPSSHLILGGPLLLLPPIPPSIRVFSNESTLHMRWPKYWSFSFNISHSSEYSGLISFRMDWLDLFVVQGILKESSPTPQFKSINSLVLSFPYSPTLTSIYDYWKNRSFFSFFFF